MKVISSFLKKHYTLILVILFILIAFYWFQLRPAGIRNICKSEAQKQDFRPHTLSAINNYYRGCLVTHGMSPESLYVNVNEQ